jgi:hypothetical protein
MKRPNATMVAQAWIKGVTDLPVSPTSVGRTLPSLENNSAVAASGFIEIGGVIGGSPELEVLKRMSVVEVKCWAPPRGTNSDKPSWNKAGYLAEALLEATYDPNPLNVQRLLIMPTGFRNARALTVMSLSEPAEVMGDESGWASYRLELQFNWVMLPDA